MAWSRGNFDLFSFELYVSLEAVHFLFAPFFVLSLPISQIFFTSFPQLVPPPPLIYDHCFHGQSLMKYEEHRSDYIW